MGAAAGAWAVNKASELQRGRRGAPQKAWERPGGQAAEETAEKLRALTGLARERLSEVMEGPVGNIARERLADLISSSITGSRPGRTSANGSDTIDTTARWPR
jgi:hypothetical protein